MEREESIEEEGVRTWVGEGDEGLCAVDVLCSACVVISCVYHRVSPCIHLEFFSQRKTQY